MPTYAPDYVVVPSRTGLGVSVDVVNATILGRHFAPQPFLTYLDQINISDTTFPSGYVNVPYLFQQTYGNNPIITVVAGSLPPGIVLTQPLANQVQLSGTPTTVGTYNFTLRITIGVTSSDYTYHLTIGPEPDSGAGGVGGG